MKKKIENKEKTKLSFWIYVIFFTTITLCALLSIKKMDNDIWYLLSEGRYIVQHGIYYIDPLSMHEGLHVVVQNWLSASIFWLLYSAFGEMGIVTLVLILNFFIGLLVYKISMLLSDDNPIISLVAMFATSIVLITNYIVTRPQVISYVILLSVIYVLEKYIKTNNGKHLIWIPILSFLEANLHASLWWMIFLFALPYVIDSFKIKFLRTEGYRKKPLLIALLVAFLVGFINPYGYKMITFIFTSFGDSYMHAYILELGSYTFGSNFGKEMFSLILITGLCYAFFREGKVKVRYICLYCGTLLLGFISIKGFSNFILVSIFPLAYLFKDIFPQEFFEEMKPYKNILNYMFMAFSIPLVGFTIYYYVTDYTRVKLSHNASQIMDAVEKNFDSESTTIYTSFNDGGYVEFRGYKAYIDPRAELYLKINNKKDDIFKENYELCHGSIDIQEFLDKYKFSLLLISSNDYLYDKMDDIDEYFIISENTIKDNNVSYRLYARKELFTENEVTKITNQYQAKLKAAEKSSNTENDN